MKKIFIEETVNKIGQEVELYGWVDSKRDHKNIVFIDLRDRSGIIQVVGDQKFKELSSEDILYVKGIVKERPKNLINPKLKTGKIEVEVKEFKIISKSSPIPIPINTAGYEVDEDLRLKYRYIDIRRQRITQNLILKSKTTLFIRNFLVKLGFIEIETPILTKTTPEGARDFLVPSRLQKGKFYALPQSPQQYKQLLMVAGIERYFQIARCFRDEDPRADRAYGEFTQLDLEMSFVSQEDILRLAEELFTKLVQKIFPEKHIAQIPWPRLSHKDAIKNYGNDKPDLRKNKKDKDELAFTWIIDFPLFKEQTEEDYFYGSGKAKFAPSHHMFTAPHPDDIILLDKNPLQVRGLQHDMVLNGFEVGGGSIRIHDPKIQHKVFDLIGFTKEQKKEFEHMLTAFTYGVPPHGGIAPGLDRFLMAILDEPSVREIIAFPTSSGGKISVMDAPSEATDEQLRELGIFIKRHSGEEPKATTPESDSGLDIRRPQARTTNNPIVFNKIKKILDENNIHYQIIGHEPVYTSEQAAKIRGTELKQGAKALVMFADKKPIMLVLPADLKVDMKKFKIEYKVRDLRMATPEEVKEVTGVEIGAVPPFGNIFNIPLYVDKKLGENETISFNAGEHTKSIEMKYEDFEKAVKPIIGQFSK